MSQVVVDVFFEVVPVKWMSAFLCPFVFQSVEQAINVTVVFADFRVVFLRQNLIFAHDLLALLAF